MKVVILAGGLGTRLSEETDIKPKPMIEIGGKPILWHIMKIYSYYGFNDFIICCGYKGYIIKEYFVNYYLHQADVTVDLANNDLQIHSAHAEPWKVTLVDTGLDTMTGSRIKRVHKYIGNERFMLTYGDGLGNVNIKELLNHHMASHKKATVTAVQPIGRFGSLIFEDNDELKFFKEKPKDGDWVNGGFFVLEAAIFDYIEDLNDSIWERTPLENLLKDNELNAYKHKDFWHPMDTLRDRNELERIWKSDQCKWRLWKD